MSLCQILSAIPPDAREITRKAITSGRIPSKSFTTISEEIDDWLAHLNDQQKIVLKQQLGLQDGQRRNLADIGREIGISRERVRQ
ncbi:MAG: sigma factor-like helix-turn-helix DNA-binding protein, partial [Nostoc sp.]